MDDLIERLRRWADMADMGRKPDPTDIRREAADRIEALEAVLREIRDGDWVENALNPQGPAQIARAILSKNEEKKHG